MLEDSVNNIYRTTNGGINWQITGSMNLVYGFITAASTNHAWVSGIRTSYRLYNTTNGGQSWQEQNYYPKNYINKIKFFDINKGYLLTDATIDTIGFCYTRNGGLNWIWSSNSPRINDLLALTENCSNALDTNFIWFCARTNGSVYKFYSLTGGFANQWQSYQYSEAGIARNAIFKNSLTGLVSCGSYILITTNSGLNWNFRSNQGFIQPRDFIYVRGTDWIIMNSQTHIFVSYDFGLTWNNSIPYQFSFYGDAKAYNSAWLSGNNGQLLKLDYNSIGLIKVNTEIPTEFKLYQNYPNPFNPNTNIRFALPFESEFVIKVFDITGREAYSVNDSKPAGEYSLLFDGANLASGIYFYRIEARGYSETKKMLMIK